MALVGSSSLRAWYLPNAVSTWLLVQPLPLLLLPDVLRELPRLRPEPLLFPLAERDLLSSCLFMYSSKARFATVS